MREDNLRGVFYVCGTPIGNLDDVTFRLIETLKAVDLVACEDTRRTLKLLSHYGIKKPVISLYEHVERVRTEAVLEALRKASRWPSSQTRVCPVSRTPVRGWWQPSGRPAARSG